MFRGRRNCVSLVRQVAGMLYVFLIAPPRIQSAYFMFICVEINLKASVFTFERST